MSKTPFQCFLKQKVHDVQQPNWSQVPRARNNIWRWEVKGLLNIAWGRWLWCEKNAQRQAAGWARVETEEEKKNEENHRKTCGTDQHLLLHLATGCTTNNDKGDILNTQGNWLSFMRYGQDSSGSWGTPSEFISPQFYFLFKWADQWTPGWQTRF